MRDKILLKALADCGSAETLAAAILKYYPDLRAPVDVEAIARSAGVAEFGILDAEGATSAMQADADKTTGIILTAANLPAQRRRFAIAHQLGHFLIRAQRGDRHCSNRDLGENRRDTPHRKEEMQANRFAAGLLMPKPLFVAFVEGLGKQTVAHLPAIARAYDVTLEAAASRYVDLTPTMCALIFVKDGVVRYARASRSFPALAIGVGDAAPAAVGAADPQDKIAWAPADVRDWLGMSRDIRPPKLTLQILARANGVRIVMLFVNAAAERRADDEAEKMATQSPKFGR